MTVGDRRQLAALLAANGRFDAAAQELEAIAEEGLGRRARPHRRHRHAGQAQLSTGSAPKAPRSGTPRRSTSSGGQRPGRPHAWSAARARARWRRPPAASGGDRTSAGTPRRGDLPRHAFQVVRLELDDRPARAVVGVGGDRAGHVRPGPLRAGPAAGAGPPPPTARWRGPGSPWPPGRGRRRPPGTPGRRAGGEVADRTRSTRNVRQSPRSTSWATRYHRGPDRTSR